MPLAAGDRLGPYEIEEGIGAGGMGEVYRARDTRLGRVVAVKVLPARVAADPVLRQRFEREARAIAQLEHPHICTLHDVGEQEGVAYLVMEHLEGETLSERLARAAHPTSASGRSRGGASSSAGRGLPLAQALAFAIEIAEALDYAHRRGIVHRDLKPENVFVTRSGVKLLDFGLAQMSDGLPVEEPAADERTRQPTRPLLTDPGAVMGTLPYMAPEQVEGRPADARSDLFAFAAVLYEMITGERAFVGRSRASLIAAILEHEPAPMQALQPLTPPGLERLVRQCLAKDPEERWQSAADLRRELIWIAQGLSQTSGPPEGGARAGRSGRRRVALAALAGAGLAALAAVPFVARRAPAPPEPPLHLAIPADNMEEAFRLALSPDGTRLVYPGLDEQGTRAIWLRTLSSARAHPLPGTEDSRLEIWSPDGGSIAFFARGKLRRLDLATGVQRVICDFSGLVSGGHWGPDDTILFGIHGDVLMKVAATGGTPTPVDVGERWPRARRVRPRILPDGRRFLFVEIGPRQPGVWLGSLDGAPPRFLFDARSPVIPAAGHLFFVRDGTLLARSFDPASIQLGSDEVTVADEVAYNAYYGLAGFSVSDGGRIAYQERTAPQEQLAWFDRDGRRLGNAGRAGRHVNFQLSPDGTKIAFSTPDRRTGLAEIWILDLGRGSAARAGAADEHGRDDPVWSPDGRRVVYTRRGADGQGLFERPAEGGTETMLLDDQHGPPVVEDWSRDGRLLAIILFPRDRTAKRGAILPLEGERRPIVLVDDVPNVDELQLSPDGRWMAYGALQAGRWEVFITGTSSGVRRWIVSTAGGVQPRWRADGKELFYMDLDGTMMAVPIAVSGDTVTPGLPKRLFVTGIKAPTGEYDQFAVAGDGRFLLNLPLARARPPVHVLIGWPSGFERR